MSAGLRPIDRSASASLARSFAMSFVMIKDCSTVKNLASSTCSQTSSKLTSQWAPFVILLAGTSLVKCKCRSQMILESFSFLSCDFKSLNLLLLASPQIATFLVWKENLGFFLSFKSCPNFHLSVWSKWRSNKISIHLTLWKYWLKRTRLDSHTGMSFVSWRRFVGCLNHKIEKMR